MATTVLNGLGQALRWLRDRLGKKQYQVAEAAGITKGMLSAYETGRQRPSLETLEKLLGTLGCDLHDLHNAIQIVNGRPAAMRPGSRFVDAESGSGRERGFPDLYSVLGQSDPLPPDLERAFGQLLDGFHKLIRYMHRAFEKRSEGDESPADESS
ncbi:MAG TPA: helix-turn-helix transcriptional regulator [Thermoanaerobaculia bacterium]|nr:helix-turn-helix transcriptional regulator [Thermoanaerobaculia bacterium]